MHNVTHVAVPAKPFLPPAPAACVPPSPSPPRLVYDTKGRFVVHRITPEEASYKLCKVRRMQFGKGGIPYIATHDGRTIRYPDPDIKEQDTIMLDLETGGREGGEQVLKGRVRVHSMGVFLRVSRQELSRHQGAGQYPLHQMGHDGFRQSGVQQGLQAYCAWVVKG